MNVINELKEIIIRDDKNWGDIGHESEETQLDFEQQISDRVFKYQGCAREVWGGWVWVVGGNEQRWSKRPTRHQCERVVHEVVERLGEEDAFDLFVDEDSDEVQS